MLPVTDGVVTLRASRAEDIVALIAGRDDEFRRFLGDGEPEPRPTAVIEVDADVVGWCDFDTDREWLEPGEVNIGYALGAAHRGCGYATRAVKLLLHHLATSTDFAVATFLIDAANARSQALAGRVGAIRQSDLDGNPYFKLGMPPLAYRDRVVTIRRQSVDDLDQHIAAVDDEQIDWLWLPGERESWEAMTADEQRAHQLRHLQSTHDSFGHGPKWCFSADVVDTPYVVYVDCDLANPDVPRGEANVSYTAHPAHRGRGYVSRAVRLVVQFLRENTGAREAHIVVDAENVNSLRMPQAVGAIEADRFVNDHGRAMVRHVLVL